MFYCFWTLAISKWGFLRKSHRSRIIMVQSSRGPQMGKLSLQRMVPSWDHNHGSWPHGLAQLTRVLHCVSWNSIDGPLSWFHDVSWCVSFRIFFVLQSWWISHPFWVVGKQTSHPTKIDGPLIQVSATPSTNLGSGQSPPRDVTQLAKQSIQSLEWLPVWIRNFMEFSHPDLADVTFRHQTLSLM